ncbi:hypothetical protein ACFVUY_40650 [Kitasatospora sp. NPDC058063]|uniref:hypothetical protein n=1 Tax=unclassified Kitasatospora TaxID=2633591 RepID=UPI0036D7618D
MSTDDTGARKKDASREDDTVRERSAEERSITAPTPEDVRANADDVHEGEADEETEPPTVGTQAT